jgi:hypothetical protein
VFKSLEVVAKIYSGNQIYDGRSDKQSDLGIEDIKERLPTENSTALCMLGH